VTTDADGVVLAVEVTPANVNDEAMTLPMLKALPKIPGRRGRARLRALMGDRAYGTKAVVAGVEAMGVESLLAGRADKTHGGGLGQLRYVVEQTLSHFGNFRRLKVCYERTRRGFLAFHHLAASLLVFNRVQGYQD
jgi:transposase